METYNGHVRTPQDAIILFEACRIGQLPRVQRRLSEKERQQIKSGSVFVWDEREAGMRRWTDGKSWSASRVSGSFLTYREMEGKRGGSGFAPPVQAAKRTTKEGSKGDSDEDGPDGYRYKPDGLMKQSFSITTSNGQHLHLISYYARSHTAGGLMQPSQDPQLRHIRPPKGMYPESSVNEASSVPAMTRAPMPGSPYAMAQSQHAIPSPYLQGAPQAYVQVSSPHWPVTPVGTPPYAYSQYHPGIPPQPTPPQHHSPLQYAQQAYPPQAYRPTGPTFLDRPPPQLSNAGLPPPPPQQQMANGITHYLQAAPQYLPNVSPRAIQAVHLTQQPNQPPAYTHMVDPSLSAAQQPPPMYTSAPQYQPQLAPVHDQANGDSKGQPTPGVAVSAPTSAPSSVPVTLPPPQTNGISNSDGPSANVIPSISALVNGTASSAPPRSAEVRSENGGSRAGSRSPSGQKTAQDMSANKISLGTSHQLQIDQLNRRAFS